MNPDQPQDAGLFLTSAHQKNLTRRALYRKAACDHSGETSPHRMPATLLSKKLCRPGLVIGSALRDQKGMFADLSNVLRRSRQAFLLAAGEQNVFLQVARQHDETSSKFRFALRAAHEGRLPVSPTS